MNHLEQIQEVIKSRHIDDAEQQDFIFSKEKRILVEAAAGYGKTRSMISKIAYLIATKKIPNPKKILALTFSVNAAYKIKKDVAEQLPNILQSGDQKQVNVSDRIYVSNYHGFCRRVLRLYGYLLHENLRNIDVLKPIDDSLNTENKKIEFAKEFGEEALNTILNFNKAVKDANKNIIINSILGYNQLVFDSFIPKDVIPYNAILSLTIKLLSDYPDLLLFYQSYFPIIVVDEFQDTNILSFQVLEKLVFEQTKIYFVGDSLQRIYGFIGAIPNLMNQVITTYSMQRIEFKQNYRFKENEKMLLLDRNVRENARNLSNPIIAQPVQINFQYLENQQQEADCLLKKVREIKNETPESKIAILVSVGYKSRNTKVLVDYFKDNNEAHFFALFSDEDDEYKQFHNVCSELFAKLLLTQRLNVTKNLSELVKSIKEKYKKELESPFYSALLKLLEAFISNLRKNYKSLSEEDEITFIRDTFDSFALKQSLEYVDEKVVFSTIHGAKGLEWDYVIMPDCEQDILPNFSACNNCIKPNNCLLNFSELPKISFSKPFNESLSVFYVGFTRARKEVFFSASKTGYKFDNEVPKNTSCMLQLNGIDK